MDEEEAVWYYFSRKYEYNTILDFLDKYHDIKMSKRTLLNHLKEYGLSRRNCEIDEANSILREHISRELEGPGNLRGYRAMWRKLHLKYCINVPRSFVEMLLREMDPEGTRFRQARRLKRRNHTNPGPIYCWHADRYDELKPYGLPIHGCIDGFSRRVMWLKLEMTNNDPKVIGKLFKDAITEAGGCPSILRTDRGMENGIMSSSPCFLTEQSLYS